MFSTFPIFSEFDKKTQNQLTNLATLLPFTFSEKKILCDLVADFISWQTGLFSSIIMEFKLDWLKVDGDNFVLLSDKLDLKQAAKFLFDKLVDYHKALTLQPKDYATFNANPSSCKNSSHCNLSLKEVSAPAKILGHCPVASTKTRCCNLMTLDVVMQCGFDCSYCSIQSFYYNNQISFIADLPLALNKIKLDPNRRYHIGTGQSSDSLMWGNKNGLLEALFKFARENQNVILEMKSKSDNVDWVVKQAQKGLVPKNVIFTWSLNPQDVIRVEERYSASLQNRIAAAKKISEVGLLVGFHFHPIIYYKNWRADYLEVVNQLVSNFTPNQIITISLGTLTFIKPVIKKIKKRLMPSLILQMPLSEASGKLSYPLEIKEELFCTVYSFFPSAWRQNIFFYLCMEDPSLWKKVFGREYKSNEEFEEAMLDHYFKAVTF